MKRYKIWLTIEECDEEHDHYQDLDLLPFGALATFDNPDLARDFVRAFHEQFACYDMTCQVQ